MAFKPVRVHTTEKEEDEEGDKDCNVDIVNNENKKQNRCSYSIRFGLVLLVLVITVIILIVMITQNNNNGDDPNNIRSDEELAAGILDGFKLNNSETSIDLDLFNQAFDVFDNDKDGYLNQTEFGNYFEIELLSLYIYIYLFIHTLNTIN